MTKYDKVMMETARVWSAQSSCIRRKVGAIISKDGRMISNGYNGTVMGSDNCCEDRDGFTEELWCVNCGCTNEKLLKYSDKNLLVNEFDNFCRNCNYTGVVKYKATAVLVSKNTVVHAEANAILFAAKEGISLKGCSIYITLSPCVECSKMIIQSGIQKVFYETAYRDGSGIKFLEENGIFVKQIKE